MLSTNPAFASKRREVVDLYVDPPAHSLVLLVDEKSQARHSTAPVVGTYGTWLFR
jgi:hypothetical protein